MPSQSKARAARKPTLRDQLARKRARQRVAHFPLDERGEQAMQRVEDADRELKLGRIFASKGTNSDVDVPALERALRDAEADRDKHCLMIRVRGLTEDERDALADEYWPDDVPEKADPDERRAIERANIQKIKRWTCAALEAAALDSDLTADEWRAELSSDRWTAGDVDTLRQTIQSAYGAQPADGIPKD